MPPTIHPHQRVLNVKPGANLLPALRPHAAQSPHRCMACRSGTGCGQVVADEIVAHAEVFYTC